MEKTALINKVFLGMEAVDGAKKVNQTYKDSSNNKYDNILNTKVGKPVSFMGQENAVTSNTRFKSASDIIDFTFDIEKSAGVASKIGEGIKKIDSKNTEYISSAIKSAKNKDIKSALKNSGKAAIPTTTALALAGLAGAGTTKAISKLDKTPKEDKNEVLPKAIGGTLALALVANGVKNKSMIAPVVKSTDIIKSELAKQPLKMVERTGPAGGFAANTMRKVIKSGGNAAEKAHTSRVNFAKRAFESRGITNPSQDQINNFIKNNFDKNGNKIKGKVNMGQKPKSKPVNNTNNNTDIVSRAKDLRQRIHDFANEDIKKKTLDKHASDKNFAKHVFKDHFLKNGLESIPYYAAPAALSYALHRDLTKGFKKNKPDNNDKAQVEKEASFNDKANHIARRSVERAADGLGRTIFPATVTAITGRNIMKSFDKINNQDESSRDDLAKVIVNIGDKDNYTKREIKREVSKAIDNFYKEAVTVDESVDIGDIRENIEKKILENKKIKSNKVNVSEGVKKQFRMNK